MVSDRQYLSVFGHSITILELVLIKDSTNDDKMLTLDEYILRLITMFNCGHTRNANRMKENVEAIKAAAGEQGTGPI
uniref:Gag/pol protein n=1 Tax=Heterorhabditis bacteriophora TaxID=37862 RepID=A0A1I7XAE4_HETBA